MVLQQLNNQNAWMKLAIFLLVLFLFSVPFFASAQNYSTLIDSGLSKSENGFSGYLNAIYVMAISAAALLAVVKIIIAGVRYMLSDIVTSKETAKKDIRTALLGLIIIISAVLILNVINPKLTNFDLKFTKLAPEKDYSQVPTAKNALGALGDWQPSDKCAVKTEPENNGPNAVTAVSVKNCDEETAKKILAEFTSLCEGRIQSSDSGTARACTARVRSANIEDLASYGDIDNDFIKTDGALITYDVDAKCAADLKKADENGSFGTDLARTAWLENCLDEDSSTGGDALKDYCEHNAGKFSPIAGNKYTCQVPKSFMGSSDFEEKFEQYKNDKLSSIPKDRQSERAKLAGASFNKEWFEAMCKDKNYGAGEFKYLDRTGVYGLSDYACVKY